MVNEACLNLEVKTPLKPLQDIEKSLQKTYRKPLLGKFIKAIKVYHLIEPNDKIAVGISGGKDSLLLAKLFMELHKYSEIPFELEYIAMNPGWNQKNLDQLIENCRYLNIPVKIKESRIFEVTEKIAGDNPCYMCARMRRGFLYQFAKEEGCNKLALGHHFDDVIETTMLNVLYGSQFKTMVPKIEAENFSDMELIRPLVLIKEEDIIKFTSASGIQTMNCGCTVQAEKFGSKRALIKELIKKLKEDNPNVDHSIFTSATNINLNQVYGFEYNDTNKDFNQIYEERKKKDGK